MAKKYEIEQENQDKDIENLNKKIVFLNET